MGRKALKLWEVRRARVWGQVVQKQHQTVVVGLERRQELLTKILSDKKKELSWLLNEKKEEDIIGKV